MLYRARAGIVKQRVALGHQIRGLLATFNKVGVAMAHRTVRRIRAVLANDCAYNLDYPQRLAA